MDAKLVLLDRAFVLYLREEVQAYVVDHLFLDVVLWHEDHLQQEVRLCLGDPLSWLMGSRRWRGRTSTNPADTDLFLWRSTIS